MKTRRPMAAAAVAAELNADFQHHDWSFVSTSTPQPSKTLLIGPSAYVTRCGMHSLLMQPLRSLSATSEAFT